MKRIRPALLMTAIIAAVLLLTPMVAIHASAEASGPQESMLINIRLDGPDVLGTGVASDFSLRVSYIYPERITEYGYKAKIVGVSTGALISPDNGTNPDGLFSLSLTGPTAKGTITIQINATATEGNITWFRIRDFKFDVVKPVFVDAVLINTGFSPANNVSVNLLVDGALKETKYYNVAANSSASVNFTWVFSTLSQGKHTLTMVLDNQSKLVEFSRGDNVLTADVYFSDSGNLVRGILVIMIIFVGVILFLTIITKGSKKK